VPACCVPSASRPFTESRVLAAADGSFRVSIENDCNGAWAHLILLASVLGYPAPVRAKLTGLLVMQPLLFALNVVRVVSLFLIGRYELSIFRAVHVYVWQFLIIGCAVALFFIWEERVSRGVARAAA
jgi:exosortase/archaeosortase family protein